MRGELGSSNNDGYGVEWIIHDGPYNEIVSWQYHRFAEALGRRGFEVRTEGEFERVLAQALPSEAPSLIEVHVPRDDISRQFRQLAKIVNRVNA